MGTSRNTLLITLIGGLATIVFLTLARHSLPRTASRAEIRRAMLQQDWEHVLRLTETLPAEPTVQIEARLLRAEALLQLSRFEEAWVLLKSAEDSPTVDRDAIRHLQAQAAFESGRLQIALNLSQQLTETDDYRAATFRRLALIHRICGRQQQAELWYARLLNQGSITQNELVVLADLERPVDISEMTEQWGGNDHRDAEQMLAHLYRRFQVGETASLITELQLYLQEHPDQHRAWALLGECLTDKRQSAAWRHSLPESARNQPGIWITCGRQLAAIAEPRLAAGCLARAIELAPASRRAHYELGQLLTAIEHPQAAVITQRAQQLFDLAEHLDTLLQTPSDERALRQTIEILTVQGRLWEARGWTIFARSHHPDLRWPEQTQNQIAALPPAASLVADPIDLRDLTAHVSWAEVVAALKSNERPALVTASDVSPLFRETVSLSFAYRHGGRPNSGPRMFEITGGGIGVIDFDRDQWPDLFFPQGGEWKTGLASPPQQFSAVDELHRNIRGRAYQRCDAAGITAGGFGQGCAVGDYNNDGFEDLLVANIGRNQLLLNMGDGTFRDVSNDAGLDRADWTTSCAMADLNSDGQPELFLVNYVTDDDVYTRVCRGHSCSPGVFRGVPDELLINTADGRFAPPQSRPPLSSGNGLGVVIADLGEQRGLDIFVANDQVQNACLFNLTEPGEELRLQNAAIASGLAYSDDGLAMACMGIASGDANGDGRLDLFVTNFRDEPNTLYMQNPGRLFLDSTRASGLRTASLAWVGWGTQFLDAGNNGREDLVLVNGHVDPHPEEQGGYAMPPQFFRNTGRQTFRVHAPSAPDDFFAQALVGRSVVRLDWNRDGRQDFAVSTLDSPARLVTNVTAAAGHWLNVRLVGTQSARDATGTRVTVSAAGLQHRQLVAGDGYMASNERTLLIGTADRQLVDSLHITWPSGVQSAFDDLAADTHYTIIEPDSNEADSNEAAARIYAH